jgi:hypothetical protein
MQNYEQQEPSQFHLAQNMSVNRLYYDGTYSSEDGVADIYPGVAEMLRNAMKEHKPFIFVGRSRHSDTIRYTIEKTADKYRLSVRSYMDEDEELIVDAIHALDRTEDVLSIEQRNEILDMLTSSNISSEAEVMAILPLTVSYEDITEKLDQLWKEVNGNLVKQFAQVKDMVKGYLT